MTPEEHKSKSAELSKLESELIVLIGETDNDKLMKVFIQWQNVRNELNTNFVEFLKSLVK